MALVTSAAASLKNTWGFSPQSIPGLQLWLDGADTTSMTFSSGSNVSSWADKSGNGNTATSAGTANPVLTQNLINGRQGISFPNTGTSPNPTYFFDGSISLTGTPSITYFVVCVPSSVTVTAGTPRILSLGASGQTDYNSASYLVALYQYLTNFAAYRNSGANFATVAANTPYVISGVATSGNIAAYQNGGTVTNITGVGTGNFSVSRFRICNEFNPATNLFNGNIGEVIVFNTALSASERQQVEGYLAAKWGLKANLPVTHPYSAIIPFNRPFYPTDISGCQLWLDAADASTVTFSSGTNISQWNDKSGNGNNMAVSSGTVSYVETPSSIAFASGGIMSTTNFISVNTVTSVFLVLQITAIPAGIADVFEFPDVPGGAGYFSIRFASSTSMYNANLNDIGWPTGYFVNGTLYSASTFNVPSGYNIISATNTSVTVSTRVTFSTPFLSRFFAGNVREAIMFTSAITSTQRQQVEQYLAWKWGLPTANLPTGHPGKLMPAFSTPFTPKSISGCALWLDAADPSTITFQSGTNMSQWSDKSGNGNHGLGRSGSGTPVVTTGGPNYVSSTNGITFDSNQFFITSGLTVPTQTHCLIAVHNPTIINGNGTGNTRVFSFQNVGTLVVFPYMDGTTARGYIGSVAGAPAYNNSTLKENSVAGQKNLIVANIAATSQLIFKNGTLQTSGTSSLGAATSDILSIGKEYRWSIGDAYEGYQGTIHEMFVFNTTLTTQQRQQVEGYLAWKWGMQSSLPSTHAYAKFSP